jgi:DNA adenine methylase
MEYDLLKMTPEPILTDIQRAARFYYLQRMAFGGKVQSRTFGISAVSPPRLNLLRIEEDLSQAHLRLARAYIERLHWRECIEKYDREQSVTFCDPPYWGTEGYGIDFGFEEYHALAEMARNAKGRMLVTVNDIPEMREVFAGLSMQTLSLKYTVGAGEGAPARELLIRNWE